MKHHAWILSIGGLLLLALTPGACGGGTSTGGTGGDTATTTITTSTSTSSGTPALAACDAPAQAPSNGACFTGLKQPPACPHPGLDGGTAPDGGALDCSGLFPQPSACGACAATACCAELSACNASPACWACLTDPNADPATCQDAATKALLDDLDTCGKGCCTADCFTAGCNPVTNDGCDTAAGEACGRSNDGFVCLPPPNDAALCEPCSSAAGPYCGATLHCIQDAKSGASACARYCCDDGDCGAGTCDKTSFGSDGVGLCVPK